MRMIGLLTTVAWVHGWIVIHRGLAPPQSGVGNWKLLKKSVVCGVLQDFPDFLVTVSVMYLR